ncbi:MAG: peptide-methionine (R)-S-oxide reductase MsrB [Alphaproteobacteria bacterium]
MQRRQFMLGVAIIAVITALGAEKTLAHHGEIEELKMSDDEWKAKLDPQQYDVLRCEGTERPGSSPLLKEHRKGVFKCAGCGLDLFKSSTKFESGTGWPSFYQAIEGHVKTTTDYKIGVARTEYHCAKCGGHQGHVFDDGPNPTGLRYCNNGVALTFVPDEDQKG